jgi:hypothetical protein
MRRYDKHLPVEPRIHEDRAIGFLDKLWSRLMRGGRQSKYERQPGEGVMRARQRLKDRRAANRAIPFEPVVTRQQKRRAAILRGRQVMSIARKEAMQRGIRGGSAIIRNPVDVDQVLG